MNKMEEVAKLLGVAIGEKFNIVESNIEQYYLDGEYGLINYNNGICNDGLIKLLTGKNTIEKLPFRPEFEEYYFCISMGETIFRSIWVNYTEDYYRYNTKNCFRTKEEITQEDIDRVIKEMKGPYEESR